MVSNVAVAAQAEMMEKEKAVIEHQQRVESLRDMVKTMAHRQIALKRSTRRAEITVGELAKLKPEHVVYQGIGRAFVRTPVNQLIDAANETIERNEAEDVRLTNEKHRASEMVVKEEAELRRAVDDFRSVMQMFQSMQNQSRAS